MNKVALITIGLVEQNEANDQWVQQEAQQLSDRSQRPTVDGTVIHVFDHIDQSAATISQQSSINGEGKVFDINLQFTLRHTDDIQLARNYINRPLIIHAWAVDGSHYIIGSKKYPAYFETDDIYDGISTREIAITSTYQSRSPILK